MRIEILEEAIDDLAKGFRFYESQRQGLGDYFLDSLFSDIESLRLFAGIHPNHFGYHRLLAKRFPYAVYYKVHEGTVRIHAVLDCRREPGRHEQRLR